MPVYIRFAREQTYAWVRQPTPKGGFEPRRYCHLRRGPPPENHAGHAFASPPLPPHQPRGTPPGAEVTGTARLARAYVCRRGAAGLTGGGRRRQAEPGACVCGGGGVGGGGVGSCWREAETVPRRSDSPRPLTAPPAERPGSPRQQVPAGRPPSPGPPPAPSGSLGGVRAIAARRVKNLSLRRRAAPRPPLAFSRPARSLLPRGRPAPGLSAAVPGTVIPLALLSQPHFAPNARSPPELISTAT